MRLDQYLVEKKLANSRTKANEMIKNGNVKVNEKVILKPSFDTFEFDEIKVIGDVCPYVSRGGYKLEKAISSFNIDFTNQVVVDIGASTGGFTDCALKHGAKKVYSIDVGYNQLDESLLHDSRVVSMEQTDIKTVKGFDEKIDSIVMDVSFISLLKVLPGIKNFMNEAKLYTLIKPQFEGEGLLKKNDLKKPSTHVKILENVFMGIKALGLSIKGLVSSPIKGKSGNIEYLAVIINEPLSNTEINIKSIVDETFRCFKE